ncbi:hypothetical protein HanRHA438_Chr03g0098151 [Helianthus annuus]|nr:hypothetical protein HanRHA438_Chr03g0098151 [Helianthus annuus]
MMREEDQQEKEIGGQRDEERDREGRWRRRFWSPAGDGAVTMMMADGLLLR